MARKGSRKGSSAAKSGPNKISESIVKNESEEKGSEIVKDEDPEVTFDSEQMSEEQASAYGLSDSELVSEEVEELIEEEVENIEAPKKRKYSWKSERSSPCGSDDFGSLGGMGPLGEFPSDVELHVSSELTLRVPTRVIGDLMASYLIMRAFSWHLRLSPFSLESFLQAMVSNEPNAIVDEIHLCLLRALFIDEVRAERMERELNLEYLDFMTWPSFIWEWLRVTGYTIKVVGDEDSEEEEEENENDQALVKEEVAMEVDGENVHGTTVSVKDILKSTGGTHGTHDKSNHQHPEYHLLPIDIKSSILRILCDHVIGRPSVRAEIDRREAHGEVIAGMGGKGGAFAIMTEKERERAISKALKMKQSDVNMEKCVLCGLGGVLMCCDSCPAAYHMRCTGEGGRGSDTKQWSCPECIVGGRGEAAGLRMALAGMTSQGDRVYLFNGVAITCRGAQLVSEGPESMEISDHPPVSLSFGSEAKDIVKSMRKPKRQKLNRTSLDSLEELSSWPHDDCPTGLHTYINKYGSGWATAAAAMRSHVEDSRKRRSRGKLWIPHGTCSKVIVQELPMPMSVSRYEWFQMKSRINRSTIRCGKCHTCLRPNLRKACLDPIIKTSSKDEDTRLGFIVALLAKMEREFWPLADKQWASSDGGHQFRNKWISELRGCSSIQIFKKLLLQFEGALRPLCFTPDWYKWFPNSISTTAAAAAAAQEIAGTERPSMAHSESSAQIMPDILEDRGRKRDVYEIGSDVDIGTFVRSHGEWSTRHFTKEQVASTRLGPPKFLIRKAILDAGRKPIPGLKYRQGRWRMSSKRLNWISEVESCKTTSDLALAIRKMDASLRWDSVAKPKLLMHTMYANAKLLGKQVGDDDMEYALDLRGGADNIASDGETDGDLSENLSMSAVWTPESKLPLWLVKSYEESMRRSAARKAIQAMQVLPRSTQDQPVAENSVVEEQRKKDEAICGDNEGHVCALCYNTNDSHKKSAFIRCSTCSREFHGYCVILTNEEVNDVKGSDWTCPGCFGSEKLIARLVKEPKAGQNLPGVDPKDEKPRENKKHPGRPPKPFFERADYKTAERKEILRRLGEAQHPELFNVVDDAEEEEQDDDKPNEPSIMPYDGDEDEFTAKSSNCPVCKYPDLGRPLITCTSCLRQFHKECMGIISNDQKLWDLRTIKCAECAGKRVRAPTENTILSAIEEAQQPEKPYSSIQDRVKQRSQRARKEKEEQKAKDANKANWMEAADRVLTRIYRMQVAEPFRFPIDMDVLRDYTNYIETPMDLETIREELYSYDSPLDVVQRVNLIVNNCVEYNGEDSKLSGQAKHMLSSFARLWRKEKLPLSEEDGISDELLAKVGRADEPEQGDAPYERINHLMIGEPATDWQRKAGKVLSQLSRLEFMEPFLRPVPKGFMNYYDVIKRPMDLGAIKSKMADGRYLDPSQLLLDMDLIWTNCEKFNQPDAPIIEDCKNAKDAFENLWLNGKVMIGNAPAGVIRHDEKVTRTDDWMEQARGVLYRLINFVPQASWFYDPVDESEAPGYTDIVKTPMDLQTISSKLQKGQYPAPGNLLADIDLITKNAEAYNGPDDEITEGARILDAAFKKYWKNAGLSSTSIAFDGNSDWMPNAVAVIDTVLSHPSSEPFSRPVNEKTAPGYSKLIKKPMDFSTIKFNLEKGSYFSPGQLIDDVAQIFQNCRSYNPPGDEIRAMGSEIESLFRKTWDSMGLPVPRKWKKR